MEKFKFKDRILMGITLFSMFFGAGNLIFPPFLGAEAGNRTIPAFIGFLLSAVCLPVLGVIAVTKSGGINNLASKIHPKFAFVFVLILYLAIGPCLAIPRTASTSFSMAITPFWNGDKLWIVQIIYSVIFFVATSFVALHPEKLTEYLGKRLTPILLTIILVLFVGSLVHPAGDFAEAKNAYESNATVGGFLYGYQTMDTLAALNFGMIVAMNVREKGIKKEKSVMKETLNAGWIAGILLFAVYGMLAFVGAVSSKAFPNTVDGTETLTNMITFLFGKVGAILLAVLFVIACFNTCVGLLSCCGKYFNEVFPKISYKSWVFIFAAASMIISNIGLNAILKFSIPLLNTIYPMAILLILLSCLERFISDYRGIYVCSVIFCGVSSIISVLDEQGIVIPLVTECMRYIPGYSLGFGWIIPTVFGIVIGALFGKVGKRNLNKS